MNKSKSTSSQQAANPLTPLSAPPAELPPAGDEDAFSTVTPQPSPSNQMQQYEHRPQWRTVDEGHVESFFDRARQGIHCSLFCGGKKCKHESWDYFKAKADKGEVKPAFIGLNSAWVTSEIVASQRPSTSLFSKYNLIQQFKEQKLTGVFNLQEKGEHSSCGPDGIYAVSGYSYNGEVDLMPHGVGYYEFPWPDMTAPDNDIVLRSVQVMASHIETANKNRKGSTGGGKVLVHCHAGLGRTGLMIACYLVYARRMPSAEAIALVRRNRPGAVQTSKQAAFVVGFETHIKALAMVFPPQMPPSSSSSSKTKKEKKEKKDSKHQHIQPDNTLCGFINRQRTFLHGEEALPYRYVPRHIHHMMVRVLELVSCGLEGASPADLEERRAHRVLVRGGGGDRDATWREKVEDDDDDEDDEDAEYASPLTRSISAANLTRGNSARVAGKVFDTFMHTSSEHSEIVIDMKKAQIIKERFNAEGSLDERAAASWSATAKATDTDKSSSSASNPPPVVADVVTLTYLLGEWFRRLDEPLLFPSMIDAMAAFIASEDAAAAAGQGFSSVDATDAKASAAEKKKDRSGVEERFMLVQKTFKRHVRHTIACFLSFIQSLTVLGGPMPVGKRHVLIGAVYDLLSHGDGRHSVSSSSRQGALRFLSHWAEAVGTSYFLENDGSVVPSGPTRGGPTFESSAASSGSPKPQAPLTSSSSDATQQFVSTSEAGSPLSVYSLDDPKVQQAVYSSPLNDALSRVNRNASKGRIISAVREAGVSFTTSASPIFVPRGRNGGRVQANEMPLSANNDVAGANEMVLGKSPTSPTPFEEKTRRSTFPAGFVRSALAEEERGEVIDTDPNSVL